MTSRPNISNAPSSEILADDAVAFQSWLDEDVPYIITNEERAGFLQLTGDAERLQFIDEFWWRRDPTPDTRENEFKEEHYRRIAYANVHFGTTTPGWKSDRGQVYIVWGKPDSLDPDRDCVLVSKLSTQVTGGLTDCLPHEVWHYNYLEAIGADVDLLFVDASGSGNYKLAAKPTETFPGFEPCCDDGTKSIEAARGYEVFKSLLPEFELPPVKFKELDEIITAGIGRHELIFDYHSDSTRGTKFTTIVPITIEVPDREFTFQDENGTATARVNIFGRISTVDGSVAETFEKSITRKLPEKPQDLPQSKVPVCQYTSLLRPGSYQLEIVVQDVASGRVGMINAALRVSTFESSRAAASEPCYFSATTNCSAIGGVCNTHDLNPALLNIF